MTDGGDRLIVGALADGGGSRALSHIGARLSVSLAIASMKTSWSAQAMHRASPDDLDAYWRRLFENCRLLLRLEADARFDGDGGREEGGTSGPFACTLLVYMMTRDRFAAAQVGDGFIVVGRSGNASTAVEYALAFQNRQVEEAGQVVWLTASNWADDLRTTVLDGPIHLVVASSDGMEKAVLQPAMVAPHELEPHGRYFEQFAAGCRQSVEEARAQGIATQPGLEDYLAAVLSSPRLDERTDDDKSMAVAVWAEN